MRIAFLQNNRIEWTHILLAVGIALLGLMPEMYLFAGFIIAVMSVITLRYKIDPLFYLFLLLLFTIPSNIFPTLRFILQVASFGTFGYMYLKTYQLDYPNYPRPPKYLIYFLSAVFVVMVLSSLHSEHTMVGLNQTARTALFFLLVYIIYSLIRSKRTISRILYIIFASALIYTVILVVQFAMAGFNLLRVSAEAYTQDNIEYINTNNLGGFFLVTLSLNFVLLFDSTKGKRRIVLWILLIILLFGIFLTNSRAAILSIAVSLIYILYKLKRKLLYKMAVAVFILPSLFFINSIRDLIDSYFRVTNLVSGRDFLLAAVKPIISDNWFLGAGPASTKFYLYKELPFLIGSRAETLIHEQSVRIEFGQAHNFYLFFLSDMGIFGLMLALLLPVVFLYYSFKAQKRVKNHDNWLYQMSVAITGTGIGFFIRGIFEWGGLLSYGTIQLDLIFWVMFSILLFIYNYPDNINLPVYSREQSMVKTK